MRCLVTGATGYVGARLVPRLLGRGHEVRAMVRSPDTVYPAPWRPRADVVRGDLANVDSLVAAFDGVDVVYYIAAAEERAARNVVEAARRSGVRRLVYLGGLHRKGVGDILLASGIETIVLRPGVIIGSGSASFEMIRHLTDRLPVMTTPKWVHNAMQPIAIRDVLHYLVEAATADLRCSRAWDIGGPDVLEYGDMMQIYADVAGLPKRHMVVLPPLTPTIASLWVGLVTPIPVGLARPLVESLRRDAVMADHDIDALIPPPEGGLTGYREAVELALSPITTGEFETMWSHATPETEPARRLPTDPDWSGETAYSMFRAAWTPLTPGELWQVVEKQSLPGWSHVADPDPARRLMRLHNSRVPGTAWLEMRVEQTSGKGSTFQQRAVFYPKGIVGHVYWHGANRLNRKRFRQLFRDVIDETR
jgi:uncharacterized protein YbjT (DUF2867 family)